MSTAKILGMILAGGEGTRLHPLTTERSKPAVPFGGRYRIVDFVLSNMVNSGIHSLYVLVQYKSQSLIEHIQRAWVMSPIRPEQFVSVVPPQMREGPEWFQGTADAVYQNLNLIEPHDPDLVAVFGADHIYRMDVRQMLRFHEETGADVTVAALPVPVETARDFGVIATDREGRITAFHEKPASPPAMPGDPRRAYASMGNYIFRAKVLDEEMREATARGEKDFGKHMLPRIIGTRRVMAYDFASNRVPGMRPYEEPAYWRDVGTVDAYYAANMDLLGLEPRLNLFNPRWPVLSSNYQGPAAKFAEAQVVNSDFGAGTLVKRARVSNSIVRREVMLEEDVEIEDCIIMDYAHVRRGSRLRRVIVDRYNMIEAGTVIGHDPDRDRARHHVTDSGIVVLPKGPYRPVVQRYHH